MTASIPIARPEMGEPEFQALRAVIESGWVTQGPRVAEFENAVAELTGAEAGVAVSSCTTALHLSLLTSEVGPGDEVIVPSMSFIATANAVVHAGATPIFAEVEPQTFNLDPDDAITRITERTKALLLVHQLGLPADITKFSEIAAAHDLVLIEDAACAIGSSLDGTRIGGHGNLACFSFHPRKLITTGEGGMIMIPFSDKVESLRRLRQHGMSVPDTARHASKVVIREQYVHVGYNYRLTDIQAAIGLAQLERLPQIVAARQERASWYDTLLEGHTGIETPAVPENATWNVQTYTVRLPGFDAPRRDQVMQTMLDRGVATRAGVMTAHREPAYHDRQVSLPISEAASDSSLAIPMYSQMTEAEAHQVIDALLVAIRSTGRGQIKGP